MHGKEQSQSLTLCARSRAATAALGLAVLLALTVVLTQSAQAQTFTVIHNFSGQDGAYPISGVTLDRAGNLYGTTYDGGGGSGTVFKLKNSKSGYTLNPLYSFGGGNDGANPEYEVVFGPDGSLYGATYKGGIGYGTVFNLKPPVTACRTALCPWTETVLYTFTGGNDGGGPKYGDLIFDQAGNIYGTTAYGGAYGSGTVFELTRSGSGWTESILHTFGASGDGVNPLHNVIFDKAGSLYGTTAGGGTSGSNGTVFQLVPSGSGWTENILVNFVGNGAGGQPGAGLIIDQSGNLYGATSGGGTGGGGTVFELTSSGGGWTLSILYSLTGSFGAGPLGNLVMDAAGNLYGTTFYDGSPYGNGAVFKLTPSAGGWTYTSLHEFCQSGPPCNDGAIPWGDLVMDVNGNLYGTAFEGGTNNVGVVWEITP